MIAWSSTKLPLISNKLNCFSQQEKNKNLLLERSWKILGNGKWVVAAIGGECRSLQAFALPLWLIVYSRRFISIESRIKSKLTYHGWFKHWASCIENTSASCSRQEVKEQFLISYLPVFSVPYFIRASVVSTLFSIYKIHQKTYVPRHTLTACNFRGKVCRQNLLKLFENTLWYVLLNCNLDR